MPFVRGHGVTLGRGTTTYPNPKHATSAPARIVAAAHNSMSKLIAAATSKQPQPTTHDQTTPPINTAPTHTISSKGIRF